MSNRVLRRVWLASICGALIGCGGAAPENEATAAPPEAAAGPAGLNAQVSVQATAEQVEALAPDAPPPAEEDVAAEPPAEEESAEVPDVDSPAAEAPDAEIAVATDPVADEPEGTAPDPTAVLIEGSPTLEPVIDPVTVSLHGDDAMLDLCVGVSDGYYCAKSLDASSDPSLLVQCSGGLALTSDCPGKCDTAISNCDYGPGTFDGTGGKSDVPDPCFECLAKSCMQERNACVADTDCSAAFLCLSTCEPTNVACVADCNYDFAIHGEDGQWRSCAVDRCRQECNL